MAGGNQPLGYDGKQTAAEVVGSRVIRWCRDRVFQLSVTSTFLSQLFLLASHTTKNLGPEKNAVSAGMARHQAWCTRRRLTRRSTCLWLLSGLADEEEATNDRQVLLNFQKLPQGLAVLPTLNAGCHPAPPP